MTLRRFLTNRILLLSLALAGIALTGCLARSGAQPEPPTGETLLAVTVEPLIEPTLVVTPTVPTATPTNTPTPSPTATETPTVTPVPTDTPAPEPTQTATPSTPPLPTPDGVARQVRVPILMYHYLSDPPPGADKYRRDLSVSPWQFEQHLAYLKEQGYQSITLYDLVNALAQGTPLPPGGKPVIITFDDGYRDNYENALPLLQKYGFTATFFVLTEVTNQGAPAYMTWDQLRAMAAAGMDVECHARVHEDLTQNDDARLTWQVLGCRESIEAQLGKRPRFVAYPSGVFDDRVAAFFASDNYWGGISTQQGAVHDSNHLFDLKRLRVRNTTTVEGLGELLAFPG